MPSDTLPTKSFISNNLQTESFSTQPRLLKNFSNSIETILSLTLQGTNCPVLFSSMRIIINSMSRLIYGSGIVSLIVLLLT